MVSKLLFILTLLCGAALAQNARYDNIAWGPRGPIPNATIAVCTQPANTSTTPCTPPANLCTSLTDVVCGQGNIVTADSLGNFHFYAQLTQSPVTVQIYGPQVAAPYITPDQVLSFPATTPNLTVTGTFTTANENKIIKCDQSAGATFDAKVNACIATVIAAGGGIADATGLTGAQSQVAEIDIGNGTVPVKLLLSDSLNDTVTMTTAGQCAFKLFLNSRIIGHERGMGGGGIDATIRAAASTNTGSLLCNDPATGLYVAAAGLTLYNPNGATLTNGAVFINGAADGATFQDMLIANYGGIGLHVRQSCCHSNYQNITADGNHVANSEPVVIEELAGDAIVTAGISFDHLTAAHPGTGKNAIRLTNTLLGSASGPAATFYNLYMEGNNSDTTTPLVKDDGFQQVNFFDTVAQLRSVASSQHFLSLVNNTVAYRPQVTVKGFYFLNSGLTFPAAAIDDVNYAAPINTDSQGRITNYDNRFSWMAGWGGPETTAVASESTKQANVDVCYPDTTAHKVLCNYNNGTNFHSLNVEEAGTCTMASGTCTVTWASAFNATPIVSATWNGSGTFTTGASLKCTATTTNSVCTSSTGTDTAVIMVVAHGNPN